MIKTHNLSILCNALDLGEQVAKQTNMDIADFLAGFINELNPEFKHMEIDSLALEIVSKHSYCDPNECIAFLEALTKQIKENMT